ncbi:hypothetical protein DM01DRAFT_1338713 [Hesseltinella vesiculosa]|uniref:RING-type domain-containing protein n=1 Tax=Hesseltinella vesiculosa TaxID=101127 RepID=A0A1X2G946_9FUNG|nr:hypothetical protein DM01DRAFT_1338713 [Hesseltinella vesiculosa]
MTSNRPMSFFRRLSRRLPGHANRRFGRQRTNTTAPSMTSSVRRATVAATHAAAAATGPHPSLTFLQVDPHHHPHTNSSAASTTSGISNTSDISQMLSEVISAAVMSSMPSIQADHLASSGGIQVHDNSSFFRFMHMPLRPQQHQPQQQEASSSAHRNSTSSASSNPSPSAVVPILIVGYRTNSDGPSPPAQNQQQPSATQPSSAQPSSHPMPHRPPTPTTTIPSYTTTPFQSTAPPTGAVPFSHHLHRRPQSAISTSSSLATLQSMPLSIQSNRTNHTSMNNSYIYPPPPPPQIFAPPSSASLPLREILAPSSASTATTDSVSAATSPSSSASSTHSHTTTGTTATGGRWLIYVWSGPHHALPLSRLSDEPTYEELLWLSNLLGPARPVTTTQQAIDASLPVLLWADDSTKHCMQHDTDRCLVCLDDFVPKQPVRVLKCRHVFHVECVDRWLVESHNSCPVCRGVPVATASAPAT